MHIDTATATTTRDQSDSRTPNLPTRKSLDAKVRKYHAEAEAHRRGDHDGVTKRRFCKACP